MSVFFDMFVPSRRHVEDERNRLEWTRDEEGEGDPHRGPIDLDGGVVSIKVPGAGRGEPPDAPVAGARVGTLEASAPPVTASEVTASGVNESQAAKPQVTRPEVTETRHSEP